MDWAELAEKEDNDDTYYKWLTRIGRRNCWQPDKRFYHADDIAVSQSFLDLYRKYKDEAMIIPTLARTEWIVNHPSEGSFKLGYPKEHQLHVYQAGSSDEYPSDIIANVWNWDEQWKVEWYENGKRMGEMQRYKGYDPAAKAICSDKEKVKYEWISPVLTEHLFHATPRNKNAKIEVKVTDRFGNVYTEAVENK